MTTYYKDPNSQFVVNKIGETIKAFGDVPASYSSLVDLGTEYVYTHLFVTNSLDQDIQIRFGSTNAVTLKANKDIWMDGFKFQNTLYYQHKGVAPTTGSIQFVYY